MKNHHTYTILEGMAKQNPYIPAYCDRTKKYTTLRQQIRNRTKRRAQLSGIYEIRIYTYGSKNNKGSRAGAFCPKLKFNTNPRQILHHFPDRMPRLNTEYQGYS